MFTDSFTETKNVFVKFKKLIRVKQSGVKIAGLEWTCVLLGHVRGERAPNFSFISGSDTSYIQEGAPK